MKQRISKNAEIKQFLSYVFVGGCATVVEWGAFWIFCPLMKMQYLLATSLAFIISTFTNWLLGRRFTFKRGTNSGIKKELIAVYIASVFGLAFNLIIMFILVHAFTINSMVSKIIATGMVFFYNFLIRKRVIYKSSSAF
ncbi:GtrA family protein [Anaerosporobacter faecicola]|uniref:GtrA family protein n=1 Tax=Anaerosporobacter faecicola TaxID=2718714 RepID=UPI00143C9654|nr:GtrA family protein [Anaerosporobacter faecicola]